MPQATTPLSVCFTMDDFKLDPTGLTDAIRAFWENNPAVQAVKDAVKAVIKPIEFAVEQVETFVKSLTSKDFDGISFGRRLEELAPAYTVHAYGLKDQAHRQLEKVPRKASSRGQRQRAREHQGAAAAGRLPAARGVRSPRRRRHRLRPSRSAHQPARRGEHAVGNQESRSLAAAVAASGGRYLGPLPARRGRRRRRLLAWTQLREVARQSTAVTTVPPG